MIEVAPNVFAGSSVDLVHVVDQVDGEEQVKDSWFVLTAARDPWHRKALGYTGRGAPKDHAEYLWAHRDSRLILNLVDAPDPAYIRDEIMDVAFEAIDAAMLSTPATKVLINCNEGKSRAPTIAMLWMAKSGLLSGTPSEIVDEFKKVYPDYAPADGMRLYALSALQKELT